MNSKVFLGAALLFILGACSSKQEQTVEKKEECPFGFDKDIKRNKYQLLNRIAIGGPTN